MGVGWATLSEDDCVGGFYSIAGDTTHAMLLSWGGG